MLQRRRGGYALIIILNQQNNKSKLYPRMGRREFRAVQRVLAINPYWLLISRLRQGREFFHPRSI